MPPKNVTTAPQNLAIALMGPTAAGKTELAIALCERLNGEVVSVDSALVYRGMNIGTAKPSRDERARATHHLIDIRDPWEPYSAADFCRDATAVMADISARGKIPVLAGGTMMYFKALLEGLSHMPAADAAIRKQIEDQALALGWPEIHRQLAQVDPQSAEKIHPHHSQRLSRALEVYRISGRPLSSFQQSTQGAQRTSYRWFECAVAPRDRALLHARIESRFDAMLALGLLDEVQRLRSDPQLHKNLPAIRAVGYRQVWEYLDGEYDVAQMRAKAIAATRQLAKRQLTWLRSWQGLEWLFTQDEQGNSYSIQDLTETALKKVSKRAI